MEVPVARPVLAIERVARGRCACLRDRQRGRATDEHDAASDVVVLALGDGVRGERPLRQVARIGATVLVHEVVVLDRTRVLEEEGRRARGKTAVRELDVLGADLAALVGVEALEHRDRRIDLARSVDVL